MKKHLLLALVFLLPTTTFASVITGTLSSSQTWTVAGGPYEVDAVTIPQGVTLTVEPGTVILPVLHWSNGSTYIFKVQGTVLFGSNTGPKITLAPVNPPLPQFCATTTILSEQLFCALIDVKPRPSDSLFLVERTGTVILQNTETSNINTVIENINGTVNIDGLKSRKYQFSIYQRGFYQQGQIFGSTTITDSDLSGGSLQEMDVSGGTLNISNTKLVGTPIFGTPYNIQATAHLSNNWWGSAAGPTASMFAGQSTLYTPWLTAEPGIAPVGCTVNCYSSVMFFPGIMGSKLYEQGTFEGNSVDLQRWSSSRDFDQNRLQMDSNGYSINNLHTKAATSTNAGVIDEILGQNVYKSFMSDLAQMKASSTIGIDYSLIPYDWRLPLSEIVQKGKVEGGNLYYGANVPNISDSFIIKELQRLADNSKTGKVTIVAHSNGGLVTKELIQTLKETGSPLYNKIDKVIMVAVPQVGTPEAVVGLLHGHGLGPFKSYISNARSRDLAKNMPMSYNLLPNQNYIDMVSQTDLNSKLVTFDNSSYFDNQRNAYGYTVDGHAELEDFIKGIEGRTIPNYASTTLPNIGNSALLRNSVATHQRIDNFQPATSTKVIQIAGWGEDTIVGIDYKRLYGGFQDGFYQSFKPRVAIDGDGTVVTPSALYMSTSTPNVERWWLNLESYNGPLTIDRSHADILEIPDLRNFIKNTVTNPLSSHTYLKQFQPTSSDSNRLRYTLHSPLTLGIVDTQGRYSGKSTSTSEIISQIPGVRYDEIGEVQTISIPVGLEHTVYLDGQAQGYFSLDIDKYQGNKITASTTFTGIPSNTSTVATLQMSADANIASSTLKIDQDGNGTIDTSLFNNSDGYVIYDTTPPELRLTFSTSTKDAILSGIDNLDPNPSFSMGTSTISLRDSQNNTTVINFTKLRDANTKLVLVYNTISRNGASITTPSTRIGYDWKLDNQNKLKDLDTKVIIKGIERNTFNYKKNNTTTIKVKDIVTANITTTIQTGFVPVTVTTKNTKDLLDISY